MTSIALFLVKLQSRCKWINKETNLLELSSSKVCIRTWDSISDRRWSNPLALLLLPTATQPRFFPTCTVGFACMGCQRKGQEWRWKQTVRLVRDPQNLDSLLFSSQTLATHVQDGTLCLAKLILRRKKNSAVLQSTVVAKLEIAGTIIIFLYWQTSY